MECLTPTFSFDIFMGIILQGHDIIFTGNYFISFCLLTHLGLTTSEQQVCSTKIGYINPLSVGTNSYKKRNVATLNSGHQAKKQCNFNQSDSRALYMASFQSCEPKRFVRCQNKVKRKYIQEQQPNKPETTRTPEIGFYQQNGMKKQWCSPLI